MQINRIISWVKHKFPGRMAAVLNTSLKSVYIVCIILMDLLDTVLLGFELDTDFHGK